MAKKTICDIFVADKADYDFLVETISKYPCNIRLVSNHDDLPKTSKIPTLYVGFNFFSKIGINISTLRKNIDIDSFWSFSMSENKDEFMSSVDSFLFYSVNNWLPSDFMYFDPIHQDVDGFVDILNRGGLCYIYYHNGALYINNDDVNYIFNLKNLALLGGSEKREVSSFLNRIDFFGFSYNNILSCSDESTLRDFSSLEDICWIKFGTEISEKEFFKLDFPNFEIWKYIPFLMSDINHFELNEAETLFLKRLQNKNRVTYKLSNILIPFDYRFQASGIQFINREFVKLAKFNFSNKRTVTGRIVSKDAFNIQNVSKDSVDRSYLISSFSGGLIAVFDYKSFETRIATYLTRDRDFISEYYDKDIHLCTAKILFEADFITEEMRGFSKTINHAILYGAGDSLITSRLESMGINKDKIFEIKILLRPLLELSNKLNSEIDKNGMLINKWGSIIKPNKKYAAFNNYMQTAASEIITDKIDELIRQMSRYKSKILFQVHDSIIFDIHPDEIGLIDRILKSMSNVNGMFFPVSVKVGKNYKEVA